MAMDLNSISMNRPEPPRILIYGGEGIGKTTFACNAPAPIVLDIEKGLGILTVPKINIDSFSDILEAIQMLCDSEHEFKTLVVDSLDVLEVLIKDHVCKAGGYTTISEPGFGKGYQEVEVEWAKFLTYLDFIHTSRNMVIILVAHNEVVKYEDPELPAYDMHDLRMHKTPNAMSKDWVDILGFAAIKTFTRTDSSDKKRNMAITTKEHLLWLVGKAAFKAKNRYNMPEVVSLDWDSFAIHLPEAMGLAPEEKEKPAKKRQKKTPENKEE